MRWSARLRGADLVGPAAILLVPVLLITAVSLDLLPWDRDVAAPVPQPRSAWDVDVHGASGTVPQADELSAELLTLLAGPGRLDPDPDTTIPAGELPIPAPAADAYQRVEQILGRVNPACGLTWPLLAGLGRMLSNHGGGAFDAQGTTTRQILGPRLDGRRGLAEITDTDAGRLDADTEWDRAVGPMQIVPAAWLSIGVDSDADGKASPHNIYDSALAAGRFLCQGEADLRDVREQARAVFRYQRSESFVRATIAWSRAYGGTSAPPGAGSPLAVHHIPAPTGSVVRPARPSRSDHLSAGPDRASATRFPAAGPTAPPIAALPTPVLPTTVPPTTVPPTPEPPTPEPPTPEPPTPEPSAPEPSAPEPSATVPPTPEPSALEPSAPEPSATEPSATGPPTSEPPTTQPSTQPPTEPTRVRAPVV